MRLREIESSTDGAGLNIGIAVSTFNETITDGLLAGALSTLEAAGVEECTVVRVPGALELGPALLRLARSGLDALVAIGAVIEGETDHYEHVATQASAAFTHVALATGIPVTSAVLTVREFSHARDRSLPGPGNKGAEAAKAAVTMVNALRQI
ncbi:MAG: 6,7-dimethyl-8-ribityllumazine synthase [Acidimicrobiia bacterium]|nr:6,7-dimethyl-8-ribityllumazine synthase [Acidimicrobiia bacterium]